MRFKSLGKLTQQQKEYNWENTISGSSAKYLVKEPYNLLREKLKIVSPFKSEKDMFKNATGILKDRFTSAMSNGTYYESFVFGEVKNFYQNIVSEDICYQPVFSDGHPLKEYEHLITSTPDFLEFDEEGHVIFLGEIKCSAQADDLMEMRNRYYYQVLHNSYVLNVHKAVLVTKFAITRPSNTFSFVFTEEDFKNYENILLTFFTNWATQNIEYYDSMADKNITTVEDNEKTLNDIFGDALLDNLNSYVALKQKTKAEKELNKASPKTLGEKFETTLKPLWNTPKSFDLGPVVLKYNVKQGKEKMNWERLATDLISEHEVPVETLEKYMEVPLTKSFELIEKVDK